MLFVKWVLSLAMAADLSLTGKVVSLQKDPASEGFLVKFQGMTVTLQVPRGPNYQCLRQGLNSQQSLLFSFDARSLKVQSCEPQSDISTLDQASETLSTREVFARTAEERSLK